MTLTNKTTIGVVLAGALVLGTPANAKIGPVEIQRIQQFLTDEGYAPGAIDGELRDETKAAIRAYQRDWDLPETGEATDDLVERVNARVAAYPLKLENNADCAVWSDAPYPQEKAVWSGECVDGLAHGYGKLEWRFIRVGAPEKFSYEGEMRAGRPHGRGVKIYDNGDRYEGVFAEGVRTGKGVFVWSENSNWAGDRYEGDFINGARTGYGVYQWAEGDRYEGDFVNAQRHGRGKYWGADGETFEGDYVDNQRHGYGVAIGEHGVYTGAYANGMRNGQGAFEWNEGGKYVGGWLDDVQHGVGVETWPDGAVYRGAYEGGKPHGFGKYTDAEGVVYSGAWAQGCYRKGEDLAWIATTREECGF